MSPKHQPARWYCDQLRQEGYRQVLWEGGPRCSLEQEKHPEMLLGTQA